MKRIEGLHLNCLDPTCGPLRTQRAGRQAGQAGGRGYLERQWRGGGGERKESERKE